MPLSTGEALIGGPTAVTVDLVETFRSALPWMLLALGGAMLVLLTIGFRSIVLPLKAIVMAAISIGASYGVLTWVFQDGHGARLLGFDAPGFIETTTPMIMMAILFELSMDYEVFMLSRMREEWLKTEDNTLAVSHGLARTGCLITGAALLLAVVIGGFATSDILIVKMLGVGMLVAVLLDDGRPRPAGPGDHATARALELVVPRARRPGCQAFTGTGPGAGATGSRL
ncbi:MMPL family transporter [Nostocoides australiense]